MREFVEASVEEQSLPYFLSGMLYDDGVIDPRDTRTVLGICLSVIDNQAYQRHGPLRRLQDVMSVVSTSSTTEPGGSTTEPGGSTTEPGGSINDRAGSRTDRARSISEGRR